MVKQSVFFYQIFTKFLTIGKLFVSNWCLPYSIRIAQDETHYIMVFLFLTMVINFKYEEKDI